MNQETEKLRQGIITLGKKVAAEYTTTHFPDWCLLKIGIHKVQGLPFDLQYYKELLQPSCGEQQSH